MKTTLLLLTLFFGLVSETISQVGDFEYKIDRREIESKFLNEVHTINIYLPIDYQTNINKYPVLYVLESLYHFTKALNAVHGLGKLSTEIPEMIIVGINSSDRWRDLTPSNTDAWMDYPIPQSGNGANYLSFLSEEVVPLIDSAYRTQPFRVVYGHSLGGLYSLYSLSENPMLFDGIIASSPNLEYDDRIINKHTRELLLNPIEDYKFIFLCGDNDSESYTIEAELYTNLIDSFTKNIDHHFHNYVNFNHWDVPNQSMIDGLRFVFNDYHLPDSIIKSGASGIERFYNKASSLYGYPVKPMVGYMNYLGYAQLNVGNYQEAIELFEYNTRLYPEDANVYDSLGEGYLKWGKKNLAIKNYEISLRLNPDNEGAKRLLEEIKK